MVEKEWANVRVNVRRSTKERLNKLGNANDTMDSIITKLLDAYETI